MLIRKSLSSLIFTQPLVGNYGVPSSARDENGLLKYFESPVRTLRENSQFVAERVLGHTMEAKAKFDSPHFFITGATFLRKQC